MLYQKNYFFFWIIWGVFFVFAPFSLSFAAMNGGSYEIYADTFSGSNDSSGSSGGTYTLRSTTGESSAGEFSGGTYTLHGGFQAMEKGVLSLSFSSSSAALGTLSLLSISSSTVSSTITTDSLTGYTLTFDEDGNLRDGIKDINDVADAEVTAGSEEYGFRTIGGGGMWAGVDESIVNGREVATSVGPVTGQETGIQFRVAIGGTSLAGSYAHVITATVTANP